MCGICGFNWEDSELIERMKQTLEHRGPDGEGTYIGTGVSLGHRRLSILDLSDRGKQPMTDGRGAWIVYNGEIYNYPRLKHDLEQKGYEFRSHCDTEVILHAYAEYGEDCLNRLIGMFAFALWDERKRRWLLARDRLGLKPLYYHFADGRLVFGSEIKSILCDPGVPRTVDHQALFDLMGYEYVPGPRTLFASVQKLQPGCSVSVDAEGRLSHHRYWKLEPRDIDPGTDAYLQLFDEVCRDHTLADVEVGAFLSGGLDSSSVVSALRSEGNSLRTFALGYRDSTYSEFDYAALVADYFDTTHQELLIDPVDETVVRRSVWHLDEPNTDPSNMPYMLICEKASEHVKVCLSGDGGDELLMGYDRFKADKAARLGLAWMPPGLLRAIASRWVASIADDDQKKSLRNIGLRFMEGLLHPRDAGTVRWQYFLSPEYQRHLFRSEFLAGVDATPLGPSIRSRASIEGDSNRRNQFVEITTWLPDCVLMKVDKMSMAHGLEVRPPFLDHRFVEFCYSLPANRKLRGFRTKWILRQAMTDRLPESILKRGKQGFSFPIKNWMRGPFGDMARNCMEGSQLLAETFDTSYIERIWSEHLERRRNHSHLLWLLLNIALWEEIFLSGGEPVLNRSASL